MSFQQGLSGLNAAAKNLDVIGNNVANSNTVGYKGAQAQFADVFAAAQSGASGAAVGIGTALSKVQQQFTQGNITVSNNPLDMAINGDGFFRMSSNGTIQFTRNGQFTLDRNGYIVNSTGQHLTGYMANTSGALVTSSPVDLQIPTTDLAPKATGIVTAGVNLDSRKSALDPANFDITDSTTYHSATSLSAYDSLGNAHAISLYFVKTDPDSDPTTITWDVFAACDGTQVDGASGPGSPIGTLSFDSTTGLVDVAASNLPFSISADVTTGAITPMDFTVNLSSATQFGNNFGVNSLTQDGYGSGRLAGYATAGDGTIQGRYSNGQTKTLAQVVMANFTNTSGLTALGGSSWGETIDSGPALVGIPGSGTLGTMQAGALEDSNIDLTAELVKMITAQRVYQSNAQTIKTQDSVLQTLVNMR